MTEQHEKPWHGDETWRERIAEEERLLHQKIADLAREESRYADEATPDPEDEVATYRYAEREWNRRLRDGALDDLQDELFDLRDIAHRAAVLVRWFSTEDVPWVRLELEEMGAIDADAQALHAALNRTGYYKQNWGN